MPPLFLSLRLSLPLFLSLPFTSNKRPAGRLSLCLLVGDNRTCPEPKEMNYLPRSLLYSWRKKGGGKKPFSCFTIELTALILHTRLVLRPQMLNAQNNPVSCCWWRCLSPAFQRSIHNWFKKKKRHILQEICRDRVCRQGYFNTNTNTQSHLDAHFFYTCWAQGSWGYWETTRKIWWRLEGRVLWLVCVCLWLHGYETATDKHTSAN